MGKKILQFIGSFHQGGSERQAVQLSRLLKESGEYEVFVATLDKRGSLLDEMEAAGFVDIPEYSLNSFLSFGFLNQLWRCSRYLKRNKIELVHTHDFYSNIFGILAAWIAGVRVRIASKRETSGIRTPAQEKAERFVYRFATAITVNANAVGEYLLEKGVDAKKITVIHNGLDLDRLNPKSYDRKAICEELQIPADKRFITLVANLRHGVKNQPMLLRCAKHLKEEFPDVHFVFAGEGERKRFLTDMSEKLGVFETTHFIDRCRIVPELISISEICVLTSFAEGFSNSILEYMAAGKPVVVTDVGGASECVEDDESGILVESDNDREMAGALKRLLLEPDTAERYGRRGRVIVESVFAAGIQVEKVLLLYRSLMEKDQ